MKIHHTLCVGLVLLLSACAPRLEGEAEIHYVGFGIETLLPVTPDNIVEQYGRYGRVAVTDPRFQRLIALLDGAGAGEFYEGATRVRIRDANATTIYLDNYGGIGRPGPDGRFDDATLERVDAIILSVTAERAAQPYSGLPLWAEEDAHAYVAETRGWPRAEYSLARRAPESDAEAGLLVVVVAKASLRDRVTPSFTAYQRVMAAQGESIELLFDADTTELVREKNTGDE